MWKTHATSFFFKWICSFHSTIWRKKRKRHFYHWMSWHVWWKLMAPNGSSFLNFYFSLIYLHLVFWQYHVRVQRWQNMTEKKFQLSFQSCFKLCKLPLSFLSLTKNSFYIYMKVRRPRRPRRGRGQDKGSRSWEAKMPFREWELQRDHRGKRLSSFKASKFYSVKCLFWKTYTCGKRKHISKWQKIEGQSEKGRMPKWIQALPSTSLGSL